MSVQLIVFPQSYDGILNPIASAPTQFITDMASVSPSSMESSATPIGAANILDAFSTNPPQTNSWRKFVSNSNGTPYVPLQQNPFGFLLSSGPCTGSSGVTNGGVYRKLMNLTVGAIYEFSAEITAGDVSSAAGALIIQVFNGNTAIATTGYNSSTATNISLTWTAQTPQDTICISFLQAAQCDAVRVINFSVLDTFVAPPSPVNLSSGEVILDLYEDEDIPLTLSVDEFKNVAEKVQSYSKAFNLPATKRNSRILDHVFEITRVSNGLNFNPYKRTQCILKQEGFILFKGYLRLIDMSEKEGEVSYNVNLYSEVIALADTLKDKTFQDISFFELEHTYNKSNIKKSWEDSAGTGIAYPNANTSGFRDNYSTLKYPFVNWTNNTPISNGSNGPAGFPYLTGLGQVFRPFINIKYLIDRIFQDSSFTYTSSFLATTDLNRLYMDFNWGSAREPNSNLGQGTGENANFSTNYAAVAPTWTTVEQDTETYSLAPDLGYDTSTAKFTASFDGQIFSGSFHSAVTATPTSVGTNNQYMGILKAQIQDSLGNDIGTAGYETFYTTNDYASFFDYAVNFSFSATLQQGQSLKFVFQRSTDCSQLYQFYSNHPNLSFTVNMITTIQTGTSSTTSGTLLRGLRSDLNQWEFLKGLITMFNLVTLPDEDNPNNIIIEPYSDVFIPTATAGNTLANRGIEHDWTDKIDVSEMKLEPLTDLNLKTIFKFVEDEDDFAFMNYKAQVQQHLYGSKRFNAGTEFNILDGEDEIVAEPFAATVVKSLMPQFGALVVPAVYSYDQADMTSEGFDNSPRIMYNNGKKNSGISYNIPPQNGGAGGDEAFYLQFSHLTQIPVSVSIPPNANTDTRDFHFGECQLLVGDATPYNLYSLYWAPYYNELYNPDVRIMTIKVNLSPSDINMFKFNDTVMIKNREFRVNKIDYKPNDLATVEFILIT